MKKHRKTKTKSEASKPLHEPEPDAAGIDVGANEIWVAVAPDRTEDRSEDLAHSLGSSKPSSSGCEIAGLLP